jgi:hypothetical protein
MNFDEVRCPVLFGLKRCRTRLGCVDPGCVGRKVGSPKDGAHGSFRGREAADFDTLVDQVIRALVSLRWRVPSDFADPIQRRIVELIVFDWLKTHDGRLNDDDLRRLLVQLDEIVGVVPVEEFVDADGNRHLVVDSPITGRHEMVVRNDLVH